MNFLDLEHLKAVRDRELAVFVGNRLFDRYVGLYPYVSKSPTVQELVGQPGAISQDCISALIVRQGGTVKGSQLLGTGISQLREGSWVDHEDAVL